MEIDEGVFSPTSVSDAVIWLHRRFTRIDPNDDTASLYLDLLPGNKEADTHSHEQLAQLTKRLAAKVNEGNFFKFDIPWSPKGLDPDGISTHAKYIDDVCNRTHQMLTELIDRAVAERLEEDVMAKSKTYLLDVNSEGNGIIHLLTYLQGDDWQVVDIFTVLREHVRAEFERAEVERRSRTCLT